MVTISDLTLYVEEDIEEGRGEQVFCLRTIPMPIFLKRVYEQPSEADGVRVLVERLWPRGLSKTKAQIDLWPKEIAPSTELRKWFNHDVGKWEEFKSRYFHELNGQQASLEDIREKMGGGDVTFVFASRESQYNNAVALKEFIEHHMK